MILVIKDSSGTETVTNVATIQNKVKNQMEFWIGDNPKSEKLFLNTTLSVEILPEN